VLLVRDASGDCASAFLRVKEVEGKNNKTEQTQAGAHK